MWQGSSLNLHPGHGEAVGGSWRGERGQGEDFDLGVTRQQEFILQKVTCGFLP